MTDDLFDDDRDEPELADDGDEASVGEPFEQDGPGLFDEPSALDAEAEGEAAGPPAPEARHGQRRPAAGTAAPLALYRRYRPETFAEVIGQDHVTQPLQRALLNNRVNHAYLFSGPRGCGKTTSARILARCLNCEQGPTPTPCGECQSCRDLARGGTGSIDVIEIDAASHGGVDDARDLRERAFFAPVNSRYKIYIVDEAHMVTTAGFNALLKLVEEPPPHVKFIFATTEPDKVIGTIRSRTHHYPFRLVPPKQLSEYLGKLCAAEGIDVEPAVLPLVVRAGAGSVRDSLSVLDQLLGGAAEGGVTYAQATSLLGYTPDSLLDEIVDAFAAGDAAGVFRAVDRVIEVGQDPRRFAEDLLRRLRDLVIVSAVPTAAQTGLVEVAADQAERLTTQASGMGLGELTRAAEVISTGITEMRGTTAPRLHLELMCARVLLPGADVDDRGLHARLDRLERRLAMAPAPASDDVPLTRAEASSHPSQAAAEEPATTAAAAAPAEPAVERAADAPRPQEGEAAGSGERAAEPRPRDEPAPRRPEPARGADPRPAGGQGERAKPAHGQAEAAGGAQAGALSTATVRQRWPEVLDAVQRRRRFTWIMLSQNAQVAAVDATTLTLALANPGARESWSRGGNEDILRESLIEVLGADLRIEAIVDGAAGPGGGTPKPQPAPPRPRPEPSPGAEEARRNVRPTRTAPKPADGTPEDPDFDPHDPDQDVAPASSEELLRGTLGARPIDDDQA